MAHLVWLFRSWRKITASKYGSFPFRLCGRDILQIIAALGLIVAINMSPRVPVRAQSGSWEGIGTLCHSSFDLRRGRCYFTFTLTEIVVRSTRFWVLMVLLAALFSAGQAAAQEPERPNIVLITIDTLRADHLSSYGYHLLTTPNLDRFAEQGVRFERAYTTIPLTGPAHTSLFTGRYPQETGARVNGQPLASDARLLTLPRILEKNGYQTAAFVSAWPLTKRLTHLDRGFEIYDQDLGRKFQMLNSYRNAEDVTPRVLSWIRLSPKQPFFLWVHFFDPHGPYELKEEFVDLESNPDGDYRTEPVDEEMAERLRNYDSEIAYTDHYVGKLLDELEVQGLQDSTVVVVASDHGESLGERGYIGHGRQLYENIVRIPLMIRYPLKVPAGEVVGENVSLLDVAPTLLDLAGIEPPLPYQGKSLRTFFDDSSENKPRTTYFVTFPGKPGIAPKWLSWLWHFPSGKKLPLKMGRIVQDEKIIWTPKSRGLEVYDVVKDREEKTPIFAGSPNGAYQPYVNRLLGWFKSTNRHGNNRTAMTKRDIEILKTLGYID